jgi:hypothetical protein
MKEKQKHLDAFELFYTLGGEASQENCTRVSDKFQITERTFWNWYKKLGWKDRVHLRNIDVNEEVVQRTNSKIADNKAKYLTYVHKLFDDWKKKVDDGDAPVEIKSASDVDKIVKLALLLQDEAGEIIENKVTVNKEKGLERLKNIEATHNDGSSDSGDSTTGPDRDSSDA